MRSPLGRDSSKPSNPSCHNTVKDTSALKAHCNHSIHATIVTFDALLPDEVFSFSDASGILPEIANVRKTE